MSINQPPFPSSGGNLVRPASAMGWGKTIDLAFSFMADGDRVVTAQGDLAMQGFSGIQTVWIDNSANPNKFTLSDLTSSFTITTPPKSVLAVPYPSKSPNYLLQGKTLGAINRSQGSPVYLGLTVIVRLIEAQIPPFMAPAFKITGANPDTSTTNPVAWYRRQNDVAINSLATATALDANVNRRGLMIVAREDNTVAIRVIYSDGAGVSEGAFANLAAGGASGSSFLDYGDSSGNIYQGQVNVFANTGVTQHFSAWELII